MDDSLIRLYDSCQENKGKYKCVIFLDIDGVLNDPDSAGYSYAGNYRGTIAAGHSVICEDMAAMLKRIVQASGGEIILTSSWRIYYHDTQDGSLEQVSERFRMLLRIFDKFGLSISGATEEIGFDSSSRPSEIRQWLTDKPDVERFVILDDMEWHWGWLADYVVYTRRRDPSSPNGWRSGLDMENVREALRILRVPEKDINF